MIIIDEGTAIKKTKMPPKKVGSPDDFYTPNNAIECLLPYINKGWRIWECASGTGNIVNFFREREYQIFGSDIKMGDDFLTCVPKENFDCIITNPPFSLKDKWLEKCYSYKRPFALLLPLTALEGMTRQEMYKKYGIQVILFNRRVNYRQNGSCWFASAWFCWGLNLPKDLNFVEL